MSSRSGIKKKSSSLARAVAPAQSKPALSALGQLIELLEESTGCRISFENLTGVSFHVEDLALPSRLRIHTCEACMFAKSRRETHADCIRNKTAVNRLATRRKKMFSGQCHIGLTELVAPLMYQGPVMGVFFLGSVVVRETATEARRKLRRYCETQGLDSRPFLAALAKAPQISAQEIPGLEARSSSSGGCIKIGKNCLCTIDKTEQPLPCFGEAFAAHSNPKTPTETVVIPPRAIVKFKAGKIMKQRVLERPPQLTQNHA